MAKILPGPKELYVNGQLVGHYEATGDLEVDTRVAKQKLNELGYSNTEYPEWMHIRQQAIYFQDTCAYLMQYEHRRKKTERPFTLIPYVVNSAFCIELYLKALSAKHGKPIKREHKLLKLYRELPESAVADIAASVDQAARESQFEESPDVVAYLTELNDAFVKWRYAFESKQLGAVRHDVLRFLRMLMFLACRNEVPKSSVPG